MSEHQEDYGNLWINRGVLKKKKKVRFYHQTSSFLMKKKSVFASRAERI